MPGHSGRKALRNTCPSCGKYGSHKVVETDPKGYRWDDESTALFQRLVGRDVSIRFRTRKCAFCGTQFVTAELARRFLDAIMQEVKERGGRLRHLDTEASRAKAELEVETDESELLLAENARLEETHKRERAELASLRIEKQKVEQEHAKCLAEVESAKQLLCLIANLASGEAYEPLQPPRSTTLGPVTS